MTDFMTTFTRNIAAIKESVTEKKTSTLPSGIALDISTMTSDACTGLLMQIFMPVEQSYDKQLFVSLCYNDGIGVVGYIESFHCHAIKSKTKSHSMDKSKN